VGSLQKIAVWIAVLALSGVGWASSVEYGDVVLSGGGLQAGHFGEIWDLTKGDMYIIVTVDLTGMVDDFGGGAHAWSQLGIRTVGYGDFNPTWLAEGAGVWLCTDYDWTVNTFDPDPPGSPILDLDDKLILQKGGGLDENSYDLPSTPPNAYANHRIWFDRDGVDPWQAQNPLAVDGGTYNTGGIYQIVIRLHATDATHGVAYMTINGLDQGFETDGDWNTMELTPAGMTFTGDMTQMQVFYGIYGYGAVHTVQFGDLVVILRDVVYVDDNWAGGNLGDRVDGHFFGYDAFATIQEGVDAAGVACEVAPGTYVEQVIINKDIALHGQPGATIESPGSQTYRIAESGAIFDPIVFVYGGTLVGDLVSGPETVDADVTGFEIDGQNRASGGSRFVGILYRNASGEISGNTIHNMFDSDGEGDGPQTFGILVYGDSNVQIIGNAISDFSRGGIGIMGDAGPAPDPVALVEGNVVTGNGLEAQTGWSAENGIQIGYGATGEIVGNTVTDCRVNNPYWAATAIMVVDTHDVVVADNYVGNSDIGIGIVDFPGAVYGPPWDVDEVEDVEVRGNTLEGNSWGLDIANGVTNVLVVYNVFADHAGDAIDVYDYGIWFPGYGIPAPTGVVIHFNSITGSGGDGLWVGDTVIDLVDATLNWWGSPEGPEVDLDADGTLEYAGGGDSITGQAAFSPWLGVDPDGDPILPGVQVTGPLMIIVAPVGPEPAGGYLNAAIRGANELPYADTIEVRHGAYDASEPITEGVTIVSEEGSASNTTLTGNMTLAGPGIRVGTLRRGFTILGNLTVPAGVNAFTIHINWNDLYGFVSNFGEGCLDATYNWWGDRNPYACIEGCVNVFPYLPLPSDEVIAFMDAHRLNPDEALLVLRLLDRGVRDRIAFLVLQLIRTFGISEGEALGLIREYGAGRVSLMLHRTHDYQRFLRLLAGYSHSPEELVDRAVAGGAGTYHGLTIQAVYQIGTPIGIAFSLTDYAGEPVTDAVCSVTLVRLAEDGSQTVLSVHPIPYQEETGLYELSLATDGLPAGHYLLYFGFGDGSHETVLTQLVE